MRDMCGERVQPAWGGPGTVVDLGELSREELLAAIDSSPHLIVVRLDNDQHLEVWDADHVGMIRPDRNIEAELSKARRRRATDLAALAVRCSGDLKGIASADGAIWRSLEAVPRPAGRGVARMTSRSPAVNQVDHVAVGGLDHEQHDCDRGGGDDRGAVQEPDVLAGVGIACLGGALAFSIR